MSSKANDDNSQPAAVDAPRAATSTAATSTAGSSTTADNGAPGKPNKPTTDRADDYRVKVKSEHVRSERPSCLAPDAEPASRSDDNRSNNNNNNNGGDDRDRNGGKQGGKRRNRGQNKKRPRDKLIAFSDKACLAVVRGQPCPFKDSARGCKYNHDLKEMLAIRPADLTEGEGGATWLKGKCPFWEMKGYCDFGIMCRLGSTHVNMSTGQNLCRRVDENGIETIGLPSTDGDVAKVKEEAPKATTKDDDAMVIEEASKATTTDDVVKVKEEATKVTTDDDAATVKDEAPKAITTDDAATVKEETPKVTTDDNAAEVKEEAPTTTNDSGAKVKEEAPEKLSPGTAVLGHQNKIMNILSKDTQIKLRKNKYPFVCKRHFDMKKDKDAKATPPAPAMTATTPAMPPKERKLIDFRNKVYIAPLTTVGNLPFRRIMKQYEADITCGEMALSDQLLSGKPSEWALLKRHPCEDVFGVQIAAGHADQYTRVAELLANEESMEVDFVDLNLGCPIDLVCEKGAGASLMLRERKLKGSLQGLLSVLPCPVTIKMRTGWNENTPIAHQLMPKIQSWGIDGIGAFMLHGRSRLQRYSRVANWDYISKVAYSQSPDLDQIPLIGNGDIFSYTDYEEKILAQIEKGDESSGGNQNNLLPCAMLGRGALIKPWLPTEIKERRHWDISATERFDMLKDFVRFGLEHWGSDQQGVNHTRRFLLEWLSFLHRYVPVGMLEVVPQHMNQRPPNNLCGRSDLETMMLSKNCADWVKISEMLLGPTPEGFLFEPKHKANSYTKA